MRTVEYTGAVERLIRDDQAEAQWRDELLRGGAEDSAEPYCVELRRQRDSLRVMLRHTILFAVALALVPLLVLTVVHYADAIDALRVESAYIAGAASHE